MMYRDGIIGRPMAASRAKCSSGRTGCGKWITYKERCAFPQRGLHALAAADANRIQYFVDEDDAVVTACIGAAGARERIHDVIHVVREEQNLHL